MTHQTFGMRPFLGAIFAVFVVLSTLASDTQGQNSEKSFSVFPILMYDTDIGFGYGAKGKFVNFLGKDESFDLLLFNSTKGERTYIFVFSLPDFEIRQGTEYPLSLDVEVEYSKLLRANFYGLGPDSAEDDITRYTDEKKRAYLHIW